MHNHVKTKLLLITLMLAAAMVACNLPFGGRQAAQETPIPVSSQAVAELGTAVGQAAQTAQAGGPFTLEMNEQQLTSAANMEMQSQGGNEFRDIQVRLRNGQMLLTGTTTQSGIDLPVSITLVFTVDGNGNPKSQVVDARVGTFAMPQGVVDQIQNRLDAMVFQQLGGSSSEIAVDNITITDGKMTIAAHRR